MAIRLKDADSSLGRLVSVLAGAGADLAGLHSQAQAYVGVLDSRFQNLAAALAGVHAESSNYTGTMWGDLLGLTASLYGNLGSIGAGYTLANATAGLPFTVNTPIPPTITSEATVTPATIGANLVNGRRLTLTTGSYGNLTISGQDQEIIIGAGCTFGTVNFSGSARRIIFRAADPRNCNMTSISMPEGGWGGFPENILIDGIRSDAGHISNYANGTRIAYLNSFIRTQDYPLSAFNGFFADIIIANCNLESYGTTNAGPRFHNVERFVVVDSRIQKTGSTSHHTFRIHGGGFPNKEYAYIGRNLIIGINPVAISPQGTGAPVPDLFINVWYENNRNYHTSFYDSAFLQTAQPDQVTNLFIRNNNFYGPAPHITSFGWTRPGWVITNNTLQAWQAPPPWEHQ